MLIGELVTAFVSWNLRHRAPATVVFYRTRLKRFCQAYNAPELGTLTPLEIDEHLAEAGSCMSDTTRHHDIVALERLQKFALEHKLLDMPVFGKLEKPRAGRRDRVPTSAETEALLAQASPKNMTPPLSKGGRGGVARRVDGTLISRFSIGSRLPMWRPPGRTLSGDHRRRGSSQPGHHAQRAQDGPKYLPPLGRGGRGGRAAC